MTIRVNAITSGQANPSPLTLGKPYKYRGDPEWEPGDPRYAEPLQGGQLYGSSKETQARNARFAIFAAERDKNICVAEAGRTAGVQPKTAWRYERERLAEIAAAKKASR